jgi:hypothetical protein
MDRASDVVVGRQLDLGRGDGLTLFDMARNELTPRIAAFSEAPAEGGDFAIEAAEVVGLPGGAFVTMWGAGSAWSNNGDILARIYDPDGIGGNAFQVSSTTVGNQYAPKVVTQANGKFAIAWRSIETDWPCPRYDARTQWLRSRAFDTDGTPMGEGFRPNTTQHPGTITVSWSVYLSAWDLAPWGQEAAVPPGSRTREAAAGMEAACPCLASATSPMCRCRARDIASACCSVAFLAVRRHDLSRRHDDGAESGQEEGKRCCLRPIRAGVGDHGEQLQRKNVHLP